MSPSLSSSINASTALSIFIFKACARDLAYVGQTASDSVCLCWKNRVGLCMLAQGQSICWKDLVGLCMLMLDKPRRTQYAYDG